MTSLGSLDTGLRSTQQIRTRARQWRSRIGNHTFHTDRPDSLKVPRINRFRVSGHPRFCIQEINIGMTADVGTLQRLPKIIPDGIVRELAYTGRRMSADRAAEVGLVNHVFADHEALLNGVHEIAAEIAGKSPLAVHGTKQAVLYARDHSVEESLGQIALWQTRMFQPADMLESFAAQSEQREGRFDDLGPLRRGLQ